VRARIAGRDRAAAAQRRQVFGKRCGIEHLPLRVATLDGQLVDIEQIEADQLPGIVVEPPHACTAD